MNDEDLKVGLIGCGKMGTQPSGRIRSILPPGWLPLSHAEAIQSTPGMNLLAVADPDETRANDAAQQYAVPHVFGDFRKMLSGTALDVVSIATRTKDRCRIIREVVEGGIKGIHAEKPLGVSRREYKETLDLVGAAGVALSYGTTRRFMAIYRKARTMLAEGIIGSVRQVTAEFGKTWLLWNHPHTVDLMLMLSGATEVEWVQAYADFLPEKWNGAILDQDPVIGWGAVQFTNGVQGLITQGRGFQIVVTGDSGSLSIMGNGERIIVRRPSDSSDPYDSGVEEVIPESFMSGTQTAMRELRDAIVNGDSLGVTPREIALSGDILFGLAWSALHDGSRICVPEVPDDFVVTGRVGDQFA